MWLKWNVVKSCTYLYHSSIKMREITLDIVLDAAGTAHKKREVMLAFWNIVSALSAPSFQRRQVQSQQGEKGAMAQAECIPDLCWPRAHRRQGLAGRCLQGVEVPRLRNIRNRKTKGPPQGACLLCSGTTPVFPKNALLSLLIQSTEWVAQWDVCKYDKPLQYYSFSFGKPFRQGMITDPWYVNDGNAEISIWVNSCIFQPWNENFSVHIPIHTWKHHGAISWLLC